jgi:predicted DNA-binding transcriptional regulator YafY
LESTTDWEDYFYDIIGVTRLPNVVPEEIKLLFSSDIAPYVSTKPLHLSQKTKQLDSGLEVRIKVIPNFELESLILSFGENVKIIEPEWFKNKIKDRQLKAVEHI